MIRKVELDKYSELFNEQVKRDFAQNNRRPLFFIKRLYRHGFYDFYALHDDSSDDIMAYAGLLHMPETHAELLDFFAVVPKYRNKNIGSGFLIDLALKFDTGGIIIECESPAYTDDIVEKDIRFRRISFYLRNGAEETGVQISLGDVGYDLLWLPIIKNMKEVDIEETFIELNRRVLPSWLAWITMPFLRKAMRKSSSN